MKIETFDTHSKSTILKRLQDLGTGFRVEPFITFRVATWFSSQDIVHQTIESRQLGEVLIIRSAWRSEDSQSDCKPGEFQSISGVPSGDRQAIGRAIDSVIASYEKFHSLSPHEDLVIVQRQLMDVHLSGVATSTPNNLYLHVEYDDKSGRTDAVTGGRSCQSVYIWMKSTSSPHWEKLVQVYKEIETLLECEGCLIEFAIEPSGIVSVFQARRVPVARFPCINRLMVDAIVENAQKEYPNNTVLSDMADWNPVEMLGSKARPLAVSLYRSLVTDEAWLRGRTSLGYHTVDPKNLAVEIAGKLYIDVNKSCLSLLPQNLPQDLAHRIVLDRLTRLKEDNSLHDCVETRLFFTCSDVCDVPRTRELGSRGFSTNEIALLDHELQSLTFSIFTEEPHIGKCDANLVSTLTDWFFRNKPDEDNIEASLRFICSAIRLCRDYGVIPFARQARMAFIAKDMFERFVEIDLIPKEWAACWWGRLDSVTNRISNAIFELGIGQLQRQRFDADYGHLRARSYDIRCLPYRELEFPQVHKAFEKTESHGACIEDLNLNAIGAALNKCGARVEPAAFFSFVKRKTLAREEIKFNFTRVLSGVLECLTEVGKQLEFSRNDLSYLTARDLEMHVNSDRQEIRRSWSETMDERTASWHACSSIMLPDLLRDKNDITLVQDVSSRPHFITEKSVLSQVFVLDPAEQVIRERVHGKIIVVEAAEPGMDWIFAYGIVGLITRYGGRNSHMAIRCEEFALPAAIGCNAKFIVSLSNESVVRLDCGAATIEHLN